MADTKKPKRMTKEEFIDKADWEGGYFELLGYGLTAAEVPFVVAKKWQAAIDLFNPLNDLIQDIRDDVGDGL